MDKYTDEQIKKALECCTTVGMSCKECPAFVKVDKSNCKKVFKLALDLIKRQEAEIERLKELLDNKCKDCAGCTNHECDCANIEAYAKSEAIKEFAERLCDGRVENDPVVIAVKCLVKEMEGESK